MDSNDIRMMARNRHRCPNVRKAVKLLNRLLDYVNQHSDGWAYFEAPRKSCQKLFDLLNGAGNKWYNTHGTISDADLRMAVAPIKRMATTQREKQKQYGNTFDFDVEAALKE